MKKVVLDNGLTVYFQQNKSNAVVIEVMVKVGSNNETETERGISHFIEHMVFEGTKKRPNNWLISNEIEKIGGEFNAYTTNERTCFYVKVLKKHFTKGVDVLSDILQNSLFDPKDLDKEKNIVIKEIDLVHDEPRYYQWDLLQRTIFKKHPSKNPVYGSKNVIKNLNREKVMDYFNRYYVPNNMIISVVGDVKGWKKELEDKFVFEKGKDVTLKKVNEPVAKSNTLKKEKRKIASTYAAMGFKTIPRSHPDSYILDVINGILGRGQSGRMFTEIRGKKGLAYDVGTQNLNDSTYGYFAVYATIDKKNLPLVKKMIFAEIEKLKKINTIDLKEAKDYIEGDYLLDIEDPQKVADQIVYWEQVKSVDLMNSYIKKIKEVTIADVRRVINKYFNYHTLVVLEGK
ncbi:insulinase family protein [Candidatus Woesearchaeota archaeon]|jgi:predicted Zn-dependent peptidase|nr:insulinase family protein [Candidatus Woesearchaeota archaeon]MBT4336030.1 insulinase family protein [Candidatus Woesearchaeota archaeon]MBT4468991.1 insulinase family protein [Candidatus Woesearchaeota archaeon]MBT6744690.1 insulinase family protein [Candidatus Woesearchaeota archaeon]